MRDAEKPEEHPQRDSTTKPANFLISSSHQGFTDRQKSIFDQLNSAECNTRNTSYTTYIPEKHRMEDDFDEEIEDRSLKEFIDKESIFKRPLRRPPRPTPYKSRNVPDYQRNPHKWTRYSLDDVPSEDMSERANTSTALSFLKELEMRKQEKMDVEEPSAPPGRVTFKKIVPKKEKSATQVDEESPAPSGRVAFKKIMSKKDKTEEQAGFQSSKLVMPEYVVGQKIVKETKRKDKVNTVKSEKEIKLDHLLDEDDEEEESNE